MGHSRTAMGGLSGEDKVVDARRAQRVALPRETRGGPGMRRSAKTGLSHHLWPQYCCRGGARRILKPQYVMSPFRSATFDGLVWLTESVQSVQLERQGPVGGPGSQVGEAPGPVAVPVPAERRRRRHHRLRRRRHYSSSRSPSSSSQGEDPGHAEVETAPAKLPAVPASWAAP